MVTDRLQADLLDENAALREALAVAEQRIRELERAAAASVPLAPATSRRGTSRKNSQPAPRRPVNSGPIAITKSERKRRTQPHAASAAHIATISPATRPLHAPTTKKLKAPRQRKRSAPAKVIALEPSDLGMSALEPFEAAPTATDTLDLAAPVVESTAPVPEPAELAAVGVDDVIDATPGSATAPQSAARSGAHAKQDKGVLRHATHNTILLLGGQLVTWGSTLILAAAYGRFLGALGFGELYLATTFMALVGFPIEFSFNQQIVRDVAQDRSATQRYLTMGLILKAALWGLLFLFSIGLTYVLGYSSEQRFLIVIFGIMLVSTAVSTTLISIQTAHMEIGMAKFGVVLEKGIDCVLVVILLRAGYGVETAAWVLLLGSVIGMGWQIFRVARMVGIHPTWDTPVARSLIRSGVSFLAYGVIGVIYYRIDTVMLSVYATATAVGVYGAAYRLFDTLMFIPSIVIGGVVSPILAKYSVDSAHKLRLTVEKSTVAMLLCSAPAATGLLVAAPNIIGFVYHRSDFNGSVAILQILAVGLVALYLNTVLTTVLVSTGQERKMPVMAIIALVFNVGINLYLIPRFMDVGAAWATSLTEALLLGIGVAMIDRSLIPARLWKVSAKILLACVVMAVVARLLAPYSIFLIIGASAVTYGVMVALLRVLPAEDTAQLKAVAARYVPGRVKPILARVASMVSSRFGPRHARSQEPVELHPATERGEELELQAVS